MPPSFRKFGRQSTPITIPCHGQHAADHVSVRHSRKVPARLPFPPSPVLQIGLTNRLLPKHAYIAGNPATMNPIIPSGGVLVAIVVYTLGQFGADNVCNFP